MERKRRIDCVRQDMIEMAVSDEMASDRGEDMLRRPQVSWVKGWKKTIEIDKTVKKNWYYFLLRL
jgi:hypothetical protein